MLTSVPWRVQRLLWLLGLMLLISSIFPRYLLAQTYFSASTPFNWIDASTHTRIGYNTPTYKFNASSGCGTTPPVLDDTLSDLIPIGFTFVFGTTSYTQLRIQTNGRIQFNNTTCGAGTQSVGPPQTYPYIYPNASVNNTLKVFGVDLDPTNLLDKANYPTSASKTSCNDHANCYIRWASIGTAPNRQFVVTWFHVPEWVTASNTSGSFDLQVVLNEDGSFVYQYGNIVHGGTGTAQIGWQLSTTDFSVLTFGASAEPPPNTAIVFFKPSSVATYRFDEGAWESGLAGQVKDSSVNNRHGKSVGSAQDRSGGYICRGAQIPANTSDVIVDAVQTGINVNGAGLNMSGTGTVTFWYKANAAWSGGSAVAAQLMDGTAVNGQWLYLTKQASGALRFDVTDSTGALRTVTTPVQSFAANTWVHITAVWNFNASAVVNSDQLKIHINGAAPTIAAFTSNGTINTQTGFLHFGDNPIGVAGPGGTVNSADGMIDEVKMFNSVLSNAQVAADLTNPPRACATLSFDHLEIRHASGSGLTCAASGIDIVACQNPSCSTRYTSGVSGVISATGTPVVNLDGMSGGFPGSGFAIGVGNSQTTKSIQLDRAGSVVLSIALSSMDPVATAVTACNFGSPACTFISNAAGFIFSNTSTGSAYTVPAQVAGVSTVANALYLRAVQSSTTNPAVCTPAIISQPALPVTLSYACNDPVTCQPGNNLTVNGSALSSSGATVNLDFNADGSAPITLRYDDVGRITLSAAKTITPFGGATAVSLTGATNGFVVRPFDFALTVAGPLVAGESFSVRATARNQAGATTPNFGTEVVPETVILKGVSSAPASAANSQLVGPVGGVGGTLTAGAFSLAKCSPAAAGTVCDSALAWSEVGDLLISASHAATSYLGSGAIAWGSAAAGPFKPSFLMTEFDPTQGCGTFTYSGQPFRLKVTAMRSANTGAFGAGDVDSATRNYFGAYAKGVDLGADAVATCTPNTTGFTNANMAATSFVLGGNASTPPVNNTSAPLPITYAQSLAAPATVTICARDADGVNSHGKTQAVLKVRNGRLKLSNVFGSEKSDFLQLPIQAQYWSGSSWLLSSDDTCTNTPLSAATTGVAFSGHTGSLSAANMGASHATAIVANGAGKWNLRLGKPSPTATGSVNLALNLGSSTADNSCLFKPPATPPVTTGAALSWFRAQYGSLYPDGTACPSSGRDPSARATFGVYAPETKKAIHVREQF